MTMLAGIILIACLDLAPVWRALAAIIWVADCLRELRNLIRGAARVRQLRLDSDGGIIAVDLNGDEAAVTLMTGSLILPELAWLRLRFADRWSYAELLTKKRANIEDWHRLQILWQQARNAFGQTAGP